MALDSPKIETLVTIDLAETSTAHIRRVVAFGAVGKLQGLCGGGRARMRFGIGGAVEFLGTHVVLGLALGKADDERGHGHFDVEFDHVGDGVELDVDDLVAEEHEADEEGVHADGDEHELAIEADEWRVFG